MRVSRTRPSFTLVEMVVVISIISILAGVMSTTIIKSYQNNRKIEAQSLVQKDLNLSIDRLTRVLRSSTTLLEATQTNFKVRGYANLGDTIPSEINFLLQGAALKYSVIQASGTAPNYTYSPANAKYYTLLGKTTNSVANPVFRYYNDQNVLLSFPVNAGSVKVVETDLSALDTTNVLSIPIIVSTKITLRNFKTNL